MPLSEHEQRLFEQIERSLAEDPKFASAVRASDPRFHTRRRLLVAAGVVIAGLALLVYGVMTTPLLSVAGFVVMLAALGYAVQSHRRSQSPDLHVVGGTTSRRRPRGRTGRRGSFLDRMEDRWRQRPEGHR
ncbi:DUF3040 domain-containing protein [Micromonospora sp. RTP1Z1]|uniref:DUF3040 domain-containing protein n=1 Tax=Micromonospora sp. RTP1Z1 TaxID=2994043 RepID=UPI0029C627C0|nr:DUF3040 domain-containing protein [Micromonospora sp. RTP1Z1]